MCSISWPVANDLPTNSEAVKATVRGIRRALGARQARAGVKPSSGAADFPHIPLCETRDYCLPHLDVY
jgi:hypothetical protein